jgi:hypothetical protein
MLFVVSQVARCLRLRSAERGDVVLVSPVGCSWQPRRYRVESWLQADRLPRSAFLSDMLHSDTLCRAGKAALACCSTDVLLPGKACT